MGGKLTDDDTHTHTAAGRAVGIIDGANRWSGGETVVTEASSNGANRK